MIIGISGKLGSGKDTVAAMFQAELPTLQIKKYADNLKKIVAILAGLPLAEMYTVSGKNIFVPAFNMSVGEMQQKIGTEALRNNFDPQVWVKSLFTTYDANQHWIITDVRFENEADYIRELGGVLIRVEGDPAQVRANSKRDLSHASETSLDHYPFDHYLTNDGTLAELQTKVLLLVQQCNLVA